MTAMQMPVHRSCMNKASLQCVFDCVPVDFPAVRKHDHKDDTYMASPQCALVGGAVGVSVE